MTVIASELFSDIYFELLPLFEEHWRELSLYKDRRCLSPNLAGYCAAEKQGTLITLTARQNGELVGYLIIYCVPSPHYSTTIEAHTDVPYVLRKVRSRGIGVRLFLEAEKRLRERKAHVWQSGLKINSEAAPSMDKVLRWLGMVPTDTLYGKWMGD